VETPDLLALFVRPLHEAGLRYMVSGALASVFYGEPRLTLDVDVVVHIDAHELPMLEGLFPAAEFYVPSSESITHHDSGQKADFYPSRRHPYWAWAFAQRRLGRIDGRDIWFAPAEYVILWKLEFFREGGGEKHVRDIRGMLLVQEEGIDRAMVERAAAELGLSSQWHHALDF
jgi:hypothetical protein